MRLTVLTPIIRPDGALAAAGSVQAALAVARDAVDVAGLTVVHQLAYWPGPPDWARERLADWLSEQIDAAGEGWLVFLDDDNLMHPRFLVELLAATALRPDAWAVLFAMDYPQFPHGVLRPQLPPRPGHVDGGQVALWQPYARGVRWPAGQYGDGRYLAALYAAAPERWAAWDAVVTSHNRQERGPW